MWIGQVNDPFGLKIGPALLTRQPRESKRGIAARTGAPLGGWAPRPGRPAAARLTATLPEDPVAPDEEGGHT